MNKSNANSSVEVLKFSADPFNDSEVQVSNFEPYQTFKENRCGSGHYIPYGRFNTYPELVSSTIKSSPTAFSCVNIITKVIMGNGLDISISNGTTSWDQIFRQITSDFIKYRSFAFRVSLNLDGVHKTIKYQPWSQIRISADRSQASVTLDWSTPRPSAIINYPIYDGTLEMGKEYIFIFQDLEPGSELFYSYSISSLLPWAEIEAGIANYFRSNAATGFQPDLMLSLSSKPSDPEAFKKQFNQAYSGTHNAGKVLIACNNGSNAPLPAFTAIPKPDINRYNEVLDKTQDAIIGYFGIPKQLLGKDSANGFANGAEELLAQCSIWEKYYIADQRQFIVDSLNNLFRELNYDQRVSVTPFDIRSLFEVGVTSNDVADTSAVQTL